MRRPLAAKLGSVKVRNFTNHFPTKFHDHQLTLYMIISGTLRATHSKVTVPETARAIAELLSSLSNVQLRVSTISIQSGSLFSLLSEINSSVTFPLAEKTTACISGLRLFTLLTASIIAGQLAFISALREPGKTAKRK